METFSALLSLCAGNSPVPGEFPSQRPVTRSFDVFFDLRLNKRLSNQSWGWWFETLSRPLWRHHNGSYKIVEYGQHDTSSHAPGQHYNGVTWVSRPLKSPATQLLAQQLVQANSKKTSKRCNTELLWGESTAFLSQRTSNVDSVSV